MKLTKCPILLQNLRDLIISNFFSRNFYEKPKKTALCANNFIFKQNQQKNKYLLCIYRFLIYVQWP